MEEKPKETRTECKIETDRRSRINLVTRRRRRSRREMGRRISSEKTTEISSGSNLVLVNETRTRQNYSSRTSAIGR